MRDKVKRLSRETKMVIFRVFPCVPWAKKFKLQTKRQTCLSPDTISSSDRQSQEVADCLLQIVCPPIRLVGSQETGRTGILPVWGVHRQDAYAPSDVHLLFAPEYAYLSAILVCPPIRPKRNGFLDPLKHGL